MEIILKALTILVIDMGATGTQPNRWEANTRKISETLTILAKREDDFMLEHIRRAREERETSPWMGLAR